jgi:hypothetical protein
MMSLSTEDDSAPRSQAGAGLPDPHGEAALVLVESLIHGILSKGGLSLIETLGIAQTAVGGAG